MKSEFEEEQELILKTKPHLRFKPGDLVFWKGDIEKKNPLIIKELLDITFPEDYTAQWFDSKKSFHTEFFIDNTLIAGD